ncbi:hypothetical protein FS842_009754 [Serendipita sp. 407]|nr:hypothetical protein FS842_009754 [Serendipita sp. 407]
MARSLVSLTGQSQGRKPRLSGCAPGTQPQPELGFRENNNNNNKTIPNNVKRATSALQSFFPDLNPNQAGARQR